MKLVVYGLQICFLLLVFSSPNAQGQGKLRSMEFIRVSDQLVLKVENPDLMLSPASVTKLIISACALKHWSGAYTFKTEFYYSGEKKNGIISGDLIAVGAGDPFLTNEKLWELVADLRAQGIKEIKGNIVIDNSFFDEDFRDLSRQSTEDQSSHAYDAPIAAFSINFNTVTIAHSPSDNGPPLIQTYPYPLRNYKIVSTVKNSAQKSKVNVTRENAKVGDTLVVNGNINKDGGLEKIYRSVSSPIDSAGAYLLAFLQNGGIKINGEIKSGRRSPQSRFLTQIVGFPLAKIVSGLNVFSNNFIADMLLKKLGADFGAQNPKRNNSASDPRGTIENGLKVLHRFLVDEVKLKGDFLIKNASGLDTRNRLSARQFNQILIYMARHFEVFPEYLASFPASGLTGTLEKRFNGSGADLGGGKIRAKTGTLTQPVSVAGIAGYFLHSKHGLIAFSILENGKAGAKQPSVAQLREGQDEILRQIMQL